MFVEFVILQKLTIATIIQLMFKIISQLKHNKIFHTPKHTLICKYTIFGLILQIVYDKTDEFVFCDELRKLLF